MIYISSFTYTVTNTPVEYMLIVVLLQTQFTLSSMVVDVVVSTELYRIEGAEGASHRVTVGCVQHVISRMRIQPKEEDICKVVIVIIVVVLVGGVV